MPGGEIDITVSSDFSISMSGPVTKIAKGAISEEVFSTNLELREPGSWSAM